MNDSIIIKSNIFMHPNDEDVLRRRILSQMQEGVVILPPYCEIVYPEYKVIEQIRAEIEKTIWEDVIVSLDGTDEIRIPRLEPDDVFEIIDKYKVESEEQTE